MFVPRGLSQQYSWFVFNGKQFIPSFMSWSLWLIFSCFDFNERMLSDQFKCFVNLKRNLQFNQLCIVKFEINVKCVVINRLPNKYDLKNEFIQPFCPGGDELSRWNMFISVHYLQFYCNFCFPIFTGDPLHSRALAHSRAPLFTQPCTHCSHSRAPREQWARLCVFTLQGCVQAARLCRGSPVIFSLFQGII